MSELRPPGPTCPECGGPVRAVGLKTVKHLLDYPQSRAVAGEGWLFCADPECDVYYFRGSDASAGAAGAAAVGAGGVGAATASAATTHDIFRATDIKDRARPHARGAERLVCYCFGYTAGDIAADALTGRHEIPAAIAAEVRGGMCACEVLNPGGG